MTAKKFFHGITILFGFLLKTLSRSILAIIYVVLIAALLLAACGKSTSDRDTTNKENSSEESIPVKNALMLATTTSVEDSGLLAYLKPEFEKDTGIQLKIIAQGTGQAIKTGENGDADVLLVHSKKAEEQFVADGFGIKRIELMYNYFVIVGPESDPAGIMSLIEKPDAVQAMKLILKGEAPFVSRGDESGTHKKELSLWAMAGLEPSGKWYISAGKGMGYVLEMASEKKAYTLTDKATYLSMADKLELEIIVDATADLLNQYSIIAVNPEKNPGVNYGGAEEFIKWMTSDKALKMIESYGEDTYGESLFKVNFK